MALKVKMFIEDVEVRKGGNGVDNNKDGETSPTCQLFNIVLFTSLHTEGGLDPCSPFRGFPLRALS